MPAASTQPPTRTLQAGELAFVAALAAAGSLSAAARELGVSTAAVSKRLSQIESRLGLALVNRGTRRMGLTPEGELALAAARRIAGELDALATQLSNARATPQGLLRVNATLGFGRSHIASVVSRFAAAHPGVEVRLQLSVNPPPLTEDAFDVCIRFGAPPESRVVARRIAANRRLLCAAPSYLERAGTPQTPHDLAHHQCIGIRQGDEGYGVWRLTPLADAGAIGTVGIGSEREEATQTVRTRGALTTNDGAIAVAWALEGHGIVMRAEWNVAEHLRAGRLVQVLPGYRAPDADIYAIYPQRHARTQRVRAFVDFLVTALAQAA